MAEDGHSPDRRSVLRALAAGSAAGIGVGLGTGSGAADSTPRSAATANAAAQYGDPETVERLVASLGEPLAEELVARGHLPEDASLSVDSVVTVHEYARRQADGVAAVGTGRIDGTEVVDVRLRRRAGDAEIEFHLHPERNDGYALVTPDSGTRGVAVFADGSTESVTTSSCCPEYGCSSCGDTRCSDDVCDCEFNSDGTATVYYTEEILCCTKTEDGTCLCGWESAGCNCSETAPGCP